MRVLVTGASGFVGRQTLGPLADLGADVHVACRRRPEAVARFEWRPTDLLEPGAARSVIEDVRPDCILHLAWCVEHGRFWTDPANLDWASATLSLARAAAAFGVKRFVGSGTCYEYQWPQDADCREDATGLEGHTLYDVAKDGVRRVLQAYFPSCDIRFAWARLFFLYGPGEGIDRIVPAVARALVAGEPALCSRGRAVRDFMDVRDAGAALARLAMGDVTGPVNIASGAGASIAEVAQMLGELAGRADLVRLGARPDRPGEPPRIVADVSRLRQEVGFAAGRDLRSGLADVLAAWGAGA